MIFDRHLDILNVVLGISSAVVRYLLEWCWSWQRICPWQRCSRHLVWQRSFMGYCSHRFHFL